MRTSHSILDGQRRKLSSVVIAVMSFYTAGPRRVLSVVSALQAGGIKHSNPNST